MTATNKSLLINILGRGIIWIDGEPVGRVEKDRDGWKAIVHRAISGNLVMRGFPTRREAAAEVRIMRHKYEA